MTPSTLGSANASTINLSLKTRPLAVIDAIWRLSAAFAGGANVLLRQPALSRAGARAFLASASHPCGGCKAVADATSKSLRQHFIVFLLV